MNSSLNGMIIWHTDGDQTTSSAKHVHPNRTVIELADPAIMISPSTATPVAITMTTWTMTTMKSMMTMRMKMKMSNAKRKNERLCL
jgi:hypothetical protein